MHPLLAIAEWKKGCSCAGPVYDKIVHNSPGTTRPEECPECTKALIDHIERYFINELFKVKP